MAIDQARDDARVALLECDGETIGFFPFHRLKGAIGKPIGGPISDYQGPILKPGILIDPIALLKACKLKSYDFNHLPVSVETFSPHAYDFTQSPHIDLSEGFDAYTERQPKKYKKRVREMSRCLRKAEREIGAVEFMTHDPADETYHEHVAHKVDMLNRMRVRSALDIGWVQKALEIIRYTQEVDFAGVMTIVRADGEFFAAHFGIRSETDWHWWFPSYNPEMSKYGPGIMVIHHATEKARDLGITRIDFGRGNSEYKFTFGNGETPLCEGSVECPNSLAGMLRKTQKAALAMTKPLPLGKYESYPRRTFARLISGMHLPSH